MNIEKLNKPLNPYRRCKALLMRIVIATDTDDDMELFDALQEARASLGLKLVDNGGSPAPDVELLP